MTRDTPKEIAEKLVTVYECDSRTKAWTVLAHGYEIPSNGTRESALSIAADIRRKIEQLIESEREAKP